MAWTTTDLLAEVRRAGQLPTATTASLADADLLAHADKAMQSSLVPLLLRVQEEYLVRRVTATLTAGTAAVPISRRAVGSRVRDCFYVRNGVRTPLVRLRPEQIGDYLQTATGQPFGYYLDAANVVLVPAPAAADTLEMAIYVRPGRFTATTNARQFAVTTDSPTAGRTTLTYTSWSPTGSTVDVISAQPPFEAKGLDMVFTAIGATSIHVATASFLGAPVVNDWVALPDTSPVIQLPVELHPLLFQRTAEYALRALGYLEEAAAAQQMADRMTADAVAVLTPRTDGEPRRVTGGLVRLISRGGYGGWRW